MAAAPLRAPTMPEKIRIIALDLDGTLLNSNKELSPGNLAALEQAAAAGVEVLALECAVTPDTLQACRPIPVRLN